jgi:cytoskeletal protein CcmA (bactofilin family)
MSSITDSAKFNSNASYYVAIDPTAGSGDTINGNLLVNGNTNITGTTTSGGLITANAGLTVNGVSTLNGAVNTSGALTVAGATVINNSLSANSLAVSGTSTLTGLLTANGGLAVVGGTSSTGVITAGSGISSTGTITATQVITAPSFSNSTSNSAVVQVITAGAFTGGATSAGGGLIELPLTTIFPASANYDSYMVYMSGSSTDLYTDFVGGTSGAGGAGQYLGQFQTGTGAFSQFKNLKGQVQPSQLTCPASPGTLTMAPDSVFCVRPGLTANTIYYTVVATNGATLGFNNAAVNIWLHFRGVL